LVAVPALKSGKSLSSCHYLEEADFETAEAAAAADRKDGNLNIRKSQEEVLNCKMELLLDRYLSSGSSAKEL
jgi:hypothetical protein